MIAVYTARNSSIRLYERTRNSGIQSQIVNTPRELSLGCGLSVRFADRDLNRVKSIIASMPNQGFAGIWREYSGVYNRIY